MKNDNIDQFKISKTEIAAFIIIGAGLYLMTHSFLLAIGVMIVLIVVVNALAYVINRRREKKAEEEREAGIDGIEVDFDNEPNSIARFMGLKKKSGRHRRT